MTSSGSSQPGRRPNWSASSTTRGGIDETPIRLFEGPPEPLRQSSQAIGDDPPRLGSSGVLQGARGGARDPIPNPDQPVSARLRCERPQAGAEMEAGSERAQPNQRLKLAGADRSNGNGGWGGGGGAPLCADLRRGERGAGCGINGRLPGTGRAAA